MDEPKDYFTINVYEDGRLNIDTSIKTSMGVNHLLLKVMYELSKIQIDAVAKGLEKEITGEVS